MNTCVERLKNGIITENPTFVMMLGMCPTLAVTTSAINGLGMGLTTTAVLVLSNVFISLLRKVIPDKVRIPAFIVIVASFVTLIQLLLQAYIPSLNKSLGVYIPLIVVNCIILGRAEAYASKNKVIPSLFDGLGMGLGFTFGLTCIGICREILGSGAIFGKAFIPDDYHITFFVLAPGAFLVLAFLTAIQNKLKLPSATNVENDSDIACGGNCASCVGCASVANKGILEAERVAAKAAKAQAAKEAAAKAKAAKEAKAKEAAAAEKSEVSNVVLSQFLGICPFLGVSKKVETAAGMGAAVTFVITIACIITYPVQKCILEPLGLEYLQTIAFILIIAALVQFVEMALKKFMPALYEALGVYLPLITTNCAVLGVAIKNISNGYGFIESVVCGFCTAFGFLISIVIMAGIRERIEHNDVPNAFKGTPIVLVTASLMAIAFCGFAGLV